MQREHGDSGRIFIGGVPFVVKFQDQVFFDGDECDGLTHGAREEIEISSRLPAHRQLRVLFHEVVHSALHVSGQTENLTSSQEEAVVSALEYKLWGIVEFRPEILEGLGWEVES
jgi:hypothetical protein